LFFVNAEYLHSGLSFGRGYDFGGEGSSENSLESSIGTGGGYGDFKNHQYIPTHHMENGKKTNHKSLALKGLLVPLAGVALLGKIQYRNFILSDNSHHCLTPNFTRDDRN
jgi:hypothetical protein